LGYKYLKRNHIDSMHMTEKEKTLDEYFQELEGRLAVMSNDLGPNFLDLEIHISQKRLYNLAKDLNASKQEIDNRIEKIRERHCIYPIKYETDGYGCCTILL
jgi:hypothetical protein